MKRYIPFVLVLVLGFIVGNVVPNLVKAAPRMGDQKFENLFVKTLSPAPDKPLVIRVAGGGEFTVVRTVGIEDDFVELQLKSKDAAEAYVRLRDIVAVSQPTN
jgi:hypothetical protein